MENFGVIIGLGGLATGICGLILAIAGRLGRWQGRRNGIKALGLGLVLFVGGGVLSVSGTAYVEQTTVIYCGVCGEEMSRTTKTVSMPKNEAEVFPVLVENRDGACGGERSLRVISKCKDCSATMSDQTTTISLCKTELADFKSETILREFRCPPCQALAEYNAEKTHLSLAQVKKNPDNYVGRVVRWTGETFNVQEMTKTTGFQVMNDDYETFAVVYQGLLPELVDDMRVRVLGRVTGSISGKNAFGATVTAPLIEMLRIWRIT